MGSVWGVTLSRDPDQRWLFVPDGSNKTVWILNRENLKVVANFGHGGRNAGQFGWVHNLDTDSVGNIYTSEVETSKRVQKFVPAAARSLLDPKESEYLSQVFQATRRTSWRKGSRRR